MPNVFARRISSLLIAATLTASATASGICAILCQQGVCCPKPEPVAAQPETCCKGKQPGAQASETPKESSEDCCKLMASRVPNPEATLVKHFEPVFEFAIVLPTPISVVSSDSIVEKPVLGFEEVRGPPDPSLRPDAPRAPPIVRV